jgi:hypothetical protein
MTLQRERKRQQEKTKSERNTYWIIFGHLQRSLRLRFKPEASQIAVHCLATG